MMLASCHGRKGWKEGEKRGWPPRIKTLAGGCLPVHVRVGRMSERVVWFWHWERRTRVLFHRIHS